MKLLGLLVLSMVAWASAHPSVPWQRTCTGCTDLGANWGTLPEDCRMITDSLSCSVSAGKCYVGGTLTVDVWCGAVDTCLLFVSNEWYSGCGGSSSGSSEYSVPSTNYSPNPSVIECPQYYNCRRLIGVAFGTQASPTPCSSVSANALYTHSYECN